MQEETVRLLLERPSGRTDFRLHEPDCAHLFIICCFAISTVWTPHPLSTARSLPLSASPRRCAHRCSHCCSSRRLPYSYLARCRLVCSRSLPPSIPLSHLWPPCHWGGGRRRRVPASHCSLTPYLRDLHAAREEDGGGSFRRGRSRSEPSLSPSFTPLSTSKVSSSFSFSSSSSSFGSRSEGRRGG